MNKSITDEVMQQIEQRKVEIRPHWHFTALTALGAMAVGLLGLLNAYLIDLMTIVIKINSSSRPMYGARNKLEDMLTNFPWLLVVASLVSFVLLIWVLRRYSRLYKVRTVWIVLVALVVSVCVGFVFSNTSLGSDGHQGQGQQGRGMGRFNQ